MHRISFSREKKKSSCINTSMNHSKLLLLGQVARELHCRPHQITYMLTSGLLPEPALRLGNQRIFTDQNVERIRTMLKRKREKKTEVFMTMREIGWQLGLSSHQIGKQLKKLGLRTPAGKPSHRAFDLKLVKPRLSLDGERYCWAWDGDRTMRLLAELANKIEGGGGDECLPSDRTTR